MKGYFSADVFSYVSNLTILKDISIIFDILKRQHRFELANGNNKDKKNLRICSNFKAVKINENNLIMNKGNNISDFSAHNEFSGSFLNVNEWLKLRAHPIDSNVITFHSCM